MVTIMVLSEVFGRNVRSARREKGWTQEQLAFEADVKRSYLSEIESGKRNPTLDIVEKIAVALGVKPGALLEESPAATPAS
ncbi:helix-turn-helix domain-containing protein [Sphingomonas hengshuiensis]|nr:helix-turn-helix transcriptional regulator [Sphingomonas hengshuiensis]